MDAAHKLLKITGILLSIALIMAAPGWAQTPVLNVSTNTVSLSSTFTQQTVNTSSTGDPITYTIGATDYSSDPATNGIWLNVTGVTTTPGTVTFTVFQTAGLSSATHTATVTLTPTAPGGVAAQVITITYTPGGGGGGGGGGTLTAAPNPLNVSVAAGQQFTSVVTISTSSATAISIGVTSSINNGGTNWLQASINGTSSIVLGTQTSLNVTTSAFNLANGIYTGTVTVTPSVGTPLAIPVNFTVGGGSGNGSWTVSPNSIPFSFTTNSGIFPTSSASVSTTSGFTNYTATSDSSWLLYAGSQAISGLSVGTAYTVSVGGAANSLATGTYTGHISISDPTTAVQTTLTVTLNVNGGNSNGLTISPNPLSLTSAVGGGQQNNSITVTSSTGGFLGVTGNLQSWITVQVPNTTVAPNGSVAFSINVNPAGLAAGTYSQSLNVTVGSQSGVLTVNLQVGGGGGGGGGTVVPTAMSFSYQLGTPTFAIAQQKIVVPAGSFTATATTSFGGSWLVVTPNNGTSVPDSNSSPIVTINPTGLTAGSYVGNVAITAGGTVQNVSVTLNVGQGPVMVPSPGSAVFVTQTGQVTPAQNVFFSATDATVGQLAITTTSNNSWITATSTGSNFMTVAVDPTGMAAGIYYGTVTVIQTGVGNSPYTYPVMMIVNGGGTGSGPLNFSPTSLSFSNVNGVTTPSSTTLSVSANVQTNFTYTTSVSGNVGNWINISPSNSGSGVTSTNLSVSVNAAGLAAGTYSGSINFNANGLNQTVPITLTVSTSGGGGGSVTANPTSLTFSGQSGAGALTPQALTISSASGQAPVTFTVTPTTTSGGTWLTTSANTSNSTPTTINVTANASSLAAGTYNGNLAIQPVGGTLLNVPVTLTITAPPAISATPTSLTFNFRAGDSAPAAQTLTIAGANLTFSATAVSNGNWLSVSPATGTAPGTVSVSVNGSGLQAGTYNGTVTVAGTNGATGSTTVNVTLTVTAPLPTITKITNAASFVAGSLSPGEIITLFAGDPAHPIGPATAVGLTLDSTGFVSTTIGGTQVLINGFASPMIYASASQVSAVVPYQLAQFTTATVLVKFLGQTSNGVFLNMTTTAPGLFTLNSSGTGPGAILNSNNSVNGPGTPATRGDTVVVYMTGEGQTSPPGVTGKVTTVSTTPPPLTPGPLLPVSVTVGGQAANFTFAGEAPGFVSGVMQLNVVIPTNINAGDQEILVTIGGNQSQHGVTVSVK